ncbi:MAG: hypothetical protein IPL51_09935 [Candidatus Competibacteraceae bacterium]|nr:hypothetical protein [Candidatus Competibacteraceae bacterium]
MNLSKMARAGVSPARMQEALARRFESTAVERGRGIWMCSIVCRDAEGQARLAVNYFSNAAGRWIYSIVSIRARPSRRAMPLLMAA